ncbi:MAG: hypothetical protein HN509_04575 [Halobacteriovoraceae bacterium]|nr:hypothetical protein [Halobacteriovoraceae bacterium]MBT5095698.1 hypothetical protein [Halobacteriovoraceae bacterium]
MAVDFKNVQIDNIRSRGIAVDQKSKAKPKVLKNDGLEYVPEMYKAAARGQEEQFAAMMIDQMNKTIDRSKPDDSATDYYRQLLKGEQAKMMTETNKGQGLQKVILDQIYPHDQRNKFTFNRLKELQAAQRVYKKPAIEAAKSVESNSPVSINRGSQPTIAVPQEKTHE